MTTDLPCITCLRFSLLLPVQGIIGEDNKTQTSALLPHLFSLGICLLVFLCLSLSMLTCILPVEFLSPFSLGFSFAFFFFSQDHFEYYLYSPAYWQSLPAQSTCNINNLTIFSSASLLRKASNSPVLRIDPCGILCRVCQRWFQNQFP